MDYKAEYFLTKVRKILGILFERDGVAKIGEHTYKALVNALANREDNPAAEFVRLMSDQRVCILPETKTPPCPIQEHELRHLKAVCIDLDMAYLLAKEEESAGWEIVGPGKYSGYSAVQIGLMYRDSAALFGFQDGLRLEGKVTKLDLMAAVMSISPSHPALNAHNSTKASS